MGNAEVQGRLWGLQARDFAQRLEQVVLPLYSSVLDAAQITPGTKFLDAGCGAGLLGLLASYRGAYVAAFDASPALLDIARKRLPPAADVREGELESLPYDDATFDVVTAVNSVFFAEDTARAIRELWRVVKPGGRVIVTAWGPPDQCEFLSSVMPLVLPLMPPLPPGAKPIKPGALSEPGALAAAMEEAGLEIADQGEITCPFVFPNLEASWIANASAGPNQLAIAHSGEEAVRAAFNQADEAHMRPDGSIRYENLFLWVAGIRLAAV